MLWDEPVPRWALRAVDSLTASQFVILAMLSAFAGSRFIIAIASRVDTNNEVRRRYFHGVGLILVGICIGSSVGLLGSLGFALHPPTEAIRAAHSVAMQGGRFIIIVGILLYMDVQKSPGDRLPEGSDFLSRLINAIVLWLGVAIVIAFQIH